MVVLGFFTQTWLSLSTFLSKMSLSDASFPYPLAASAIRCKCQRFPRNTVQNGFEWWHQKVRNTSPTIFHPFSLPLSTSAEGEISSWLRSFHLKGLQKPSSPPAQFYSLGSKTPGKEEGLCPPAHTEWGPLSLPFCAGDRPGLERRGRHQR